MAAKKKVLIVDDEPDAVETTSAILSDIEGVSVISAGNADDGVKKAKEEKPDLIILDVDMPLKTGFDAFSELKKNETTKDIPVVMLTGVEEKRGIGFSSREMQDFLGHAPAAYIEKPVDPEQLQGKVAELLGP